MKFNAQRKKYKGVQYRSLFEVDVVKELTKLRKLYDRSFDVGYETDKFSYVLRRSYIPDFKIVRSDGTILFIEAKGVLDRETKAKMLAVREDNPEFTFVLLFPAPPSLSKKRAKAYAKWCEKHDIDYSIGAIKPEWLGEVQ